MKISTQLCLGLAVAALTGCITMPLPPPGLVTNVTGPNHAVEGKHNVTKRGESCAQGILGLVAWGDASIEGARKAGGVAQIAAVDYHDMDVLGFVYSSTCTIVTGT